MSDFITFLQLINDEAMSMSKFIILMATLIILMVIYRLPEIIHAYQKYKTHNPNVKEFL